MRRSLGLAIAVSLLMLGACRDESRPGKLFPRGFNDQDMADVLRVTGMTSFSISQAPQVTDKGIAELRTRLPHADKDTIDALAKDPRVENVEDLFTVNMVVNFLNAKLNA